MNASKLNPLHLLTKLLHPHPQVPDSVLRAQVGAYGGRVPVQREGESK